MWHFLLGRYVGYQIHRGTVIAKARLGATVNQSSR